MPVQTDRQRLLTIAVDAIGTWCAPPERLTVTQWAEKYRRLADAAGIGHPYRASVTPYARRPQDLMADPSVSMIVLEFAVQSGKSSCIENNLGYRIHQRPGPMMLVRPKIDDAEAWMRERFRTMVRSTEALRKLITLGRAGESLLRFQTFPGGFLFAAAATSATELASRPVPDLFIDEADRMEFIQGEGSPIEIARKRQAATDIGITVIASTPRDAETTLIHPYYVDGTQEKYEVPCPFCGVMQPLVWGAREEEQGTGLKWQRDRPDTAQYLCKQCQRLIPETQKAEMLLHGEWKATNASGEYPSFHLNALYSPFAKSAWAVLANEWVKAQDRPADLRVFVNTRLAEVYEDRTEKVDPGILSRTDEQDNYEENTVPHGVGLLTAGVDVQDGWCMVHVWGWGVGLESWPICLTFVVGDTSKLPEEPGSVWRELDTILNRRFRHVSGRELLISGALVDSGYRTGIVYAFTKKRARRRIYACKGIGGEGLPNVGKPTRHGKSQTIMYPLGVDAYKDEFILSQVHITQPGPGYVHVPTWVDEETRAGWVSEKRARRLEKGRMVRFWRPKYEGARTEALDTRIYARAALDVLGPAYLDTMEEAVRTASTSPDLKENVGTDEPEESPPSQGNSYVKGWWYTS